MSSIYPDELVFGITWDFTDVQFSSLKAFNDAVRKYQENNNCWYPELIILNVPQVKIIISDYDALIEGDSDVLVDTVLMADNGQSFTAGELLLKTHNAFAVEKIASLAKGHFSGSMHVEELDGESTLLSYNCCCFLSCTAYDNIKTASVANSNNSSDHDVHELKSSLNCPNCHSDEWRLASMIYQDGLTHVNTSSNTVGVGVSSGIGVGVGYSETTGLHQTELSRFLTSRQVRQAPS
jgi:hypothetical protein